MPSNIQAYRQMADHTAMQITGSHQSWMAFLETAARLYKYCQASEISVCLYHKQIGGISVRFVLKIICAPVVAMLAVVVWFFAFLLNLSSVVFGIAGTVFSILGAIILFTESVKNGVIVLVIAFLVSPFGLPMLAAWLVGCLQQLRYAIQDKVYG